MYLNNVLSHAGNRSGSRSSFAPRRVKGGKSELHRVGRLEKLTMRGRIEGPSGHIPKERTVSQRTDFFRKEDTGETVV